MVKNAVLEKIRNGEPALGIACATGEPILTEYLAHAGFDWIWVETRHGYYSYDRMLHAIQIINATDTVPIVRPAENNFGLINRALDAGALGLIVPMVNSAEEARQAARAVRFPPQGDRSIGPFGTAFLGDDYVARINDEVYLAVQIETATAAANAEEILAVEGVDGCWCGPGDMGLSMGLRPGSPEEQPELEAALMGVLEACYKTGKVPGVACVPGNARYWLDKGFRFVTIGGEGSLLRSAAQQVLASLRQG